MSWRTIYRAIIGYDVGVFLSLAIKIFVYREHADNIEFINVAVCMCSVFYFWERAEWTELFKNLTRREK